MDEKYTVKGLTSIQGNHDVMHCEIPNCETCAAFWVYAKLLRNQVDLSEPSSPTQHPKQYIREQYQAGKSIREIAFNIDWNDDEVIQYLRERKLYIETKKRYRARHHSPVQLRLQLGLTKSAKRMQQDSFEIKKLIEQGYSKQAIARKLYKTVQAVGQYINLHDLPQIKQSSILIYDVTFNFDQHRYFDRNGQEYRLTRVQ